MIEFLFSDQPLQADAGTFVATVPEHIRSEKALFEVYDEIFRFPYFGFNWDALHDVLTDLEWIPQEAVTIRHGDLPDLPPVALKIYLSTLRDLDERQLERARREIMLPFVEKSYRVIFPTAARAKVFQILDS